jgi:hypothetical protein
MITMTRTQTERVEAVSKSLADLARPLQRKAEEFGYPNEFVTALCVSSALNLIGVQADLVAGSAAWLVMGDEMQGEALLEGRKVIPFFGYKFNAAKALPTMVKFEYPEDIHSFVIDYEGIIYDFTLADQRASFEALSKTKWPAKTAPPDVIVGCQEDLVVCGWQYAPDQQASEFVKMLAHRLCVASAFSP